MSALVPYSTDDSSDLIDPVQNLSLENENASGRVSPLLLLHPWSPSPSSPSPSPSSTSSSSNLHKISTQLSLINVDPRRSPPVDSSRPTLTLKMASASSSEKKKSRSLSRPHPYRSNTKSKPSISRSELEVSERQDDFTRPSSVSFDLRYLKTLGYVEYSKEKTKKSEGNEMKHLFEEIYSNLDQIFAKFVDGDEEKKKTKRKGGNECS